MVVAGSALQETTAKEMDWSSLGVASVECGVGEVEWLEDELSRPLDDVAEQETAPVSAGMGADSRLVIEKVLISPGTDCRRPKGLKMGRMGLW